MQWPPRLQSHSVPHNKSAVQIKVVFDSVVAFLARTNKGLTASSELTKNSNLSPCLNHQLTQRNRFRRHYTTIQYVCHKGSYQKTDTLERGNQLPPSWSIYPTSSAPNSHIQLFLPDFLPPQCGMDLTSSSPLQHPPHSSLDLEVSHSHEVRLHRWDAALHCNCNNRMIGVAVLTYSQCAHLVLGLSFSIQFEQLGM